MTPGVESKVCLKIPLPLRFCKAYRQASRPLLTSDARPLVFSAEVKSFSSNDLRLDEKCIVLEGRLEKLTEGMIGTGLMKQFKPRWVRLFRVPDSLFSDGAVLVYYGSDKKTGMETAIRRLLSLWSLSRIVTSPTEMSATSFARVSKQDKSAQQCMFEIRLDRVDASGGNFLFKCKDQNERDAWVEALQKICVECRPKDPIRSMVLRGTLRGISEDEKKQSEDVKQDSLRVHVLRPSGEEMFKLDLPRDGDVLLLKQRIHDEQSVYGPSLSQMVVRFNGAKLRDDSKTFADLELRNGDRFILVK